MAQSKSDKPIRDFKIVAHKQSFDKANEWLKKVIEEASKEEGRDLMNDFEEEHMQLVEMKNKDFRDVMYEIEEDFIVVTDPPYNIGYEYNEYPDDLSTKDYVEMIGNLKGKRTAIIHYPEETMKYFVPA